MLRECLIFALDDPRYALPLPIVERVIRAVEVTPLPKAPRQVLGLINAQGRIIPVIDVRAILGLPEREMDLGDRFIIARTPRRVVALLVDDVIGICVLPEGEPARAESALPLAEHLRGAAQAQGGIILIYDIDGFLSLDDERLLDTALSGGES